KALDVAAIAPELLPDEALTAAAAAPQPVVAPVEPPSGQVTTPLPASPARAAPTAQPAPVDAAPVLPGREQRPTQERQEFTRVDAGLLDSLLNNAGEVSIFRARLEQQVSAIEFNLSELGRTVTRDRKSTRLNSSHV